MNKPVHLKMVIAPAIKGQMAKQFADLIATVSKITGFEIDIEEACSYQEAIDALKQGKAQMGWLGAQAYLEGAYEANIEAFAVATRGKIGRAHV